jgi:hypothetical protein
MSFLQTSIHNLPVYGSGGIKGCWRGDFDLEITVQYLLPAWMCRSLLVPAPFSLCSEHWEFEDEIFCSLVIFFNAVKHSRWNFTISNTLVVGSTQLLYISSKDALWQFDGSKSWLYGSGTRYRACDGSAVKHVRPSGNGGVHVSSIKSDRCR